MTIRAYLWGMRFSTLAALVAMGLVVKYINPTQDGLLGQGLFYVSLFFSITGIATLFLFWLRRTFSKSGAVQESVGVSFRQSALIAVAVCALLLLQSFRLLVWWDGGIVVAGVLLIELWFLSR
jgi:Na+/melibiose symporter-like transporter